MSPRRIVAGLLFVAVSTVLGYWAYLEWLAPGSETNAVQTDEIDRIQVDTGVSLASAEGQIVPSRYATLSVQTAGEIAEILVNAGDTVSKGDPLLRLEAPELAIHLRQAEAGVMAAEAALASAQAGLALAQDGVAVAESSARIAEAQLTLLESDPLDEEVAVALSNVALAEAGIEQARANRQLVLEVPLSKIRSAEAMVAAATAEERVLQDQYDTLIRNEIGGTPEEQTRLALNAAVANRLAAQAALNEINAGATLGQRRAADAAVLSATAQKELAEAQVGLLFAGAKDEQVSLSELGIAQSEATIAQAEGVVAQSAAAVGQAEAGLHQAKEAVALAQASIDKLVIEAPFDGTVAELLANLGENVIPGMPLLILADFNELLVETSDMSELDVVAVAVGAAAVIRIDAIPGETFNGKVTRIADVSSLSRGDVTYAVTISIDDADRWPLRWGMNVFVDVDVDQ